MWLKKHPFIVVRGASRYFHNPGELFLKIQIWRLRFKISLILFE